MDGLLGKSQFGWFVFMSVILERNVTFIQSG